MEESNEIDESLYSRQLYVLGREAMSRMARSSVLICGLGGLGVEVAKNVILSGVKSVTLWDPTPASYLDLSAQFYLSESDLGISRASSSLERLRELNPKVQVSCSSSSALDEPFLSQFSVVVATCGTLNEYFRLNDLCRAHGVPFILGECLGVFSRIFCDLIEYSTADPSGEKNRVLMIASITDDDEGVVTFLKDDGHLLSTGDRVRIDDVQGMSELNGTERTVTVLSPQTISIGSTKGLHPYINRGTMTVLTAPYHASFLPMKEALGKPELVIESTEKTQLTQVAFQIFDSFVQKFSRLPVPGDVSDMEWAAQQLAASASAETVLYMKKFFSQSRGSVSPYCSAIGGIVAQEVLKACSHKFTPIHQFLYHDDVESLPSELLPIDEVRARNCRYDGEIAVFGSTLHNSVMNLKYFCVGAGAIGCEILKNWACMGLGAGANGMIYVTDPDCIEVSNLSRQFLFRQSDVKKSKSQVASESIARMNHELHIIAHQNRVEPASESVYNDAFIKHLDGVCNALDNVKTRQYTDGRCVLFQKPLLESGTLGAKGHTQIVVPYLSQSYGDSVDGPDESFPLCTLKNFPYLIEHTIQIFELQFNQVPSDINSYLTNHNYLSAIQREPATAVSKIEMIAHNLNNKPTNYRHCLQWARKLFDDLFVHEINSLLETHPKDHLTEEGIPFWLGTKRAPTPLVFDIDNPIHFSFIRSAAVLRGTVFGLSSIYTDNELYQIIPSLDYSAQRTVFKESFGATDDVKSTVKKLPAQSSLAGYRCNVIEFDKDGVESHIEFITACSNLRAINYEIEPKDAFETKMIAGKIIPAIATTTALVSGLICLEIYKLLQKKPLEQFKCSYVNLALSVFQQFEPTPCPSSMHKGHRWTKWDVIDLDTENGLTLREFLDLLQREYGLAIMMIGYGPAMLYNSLFPMKKVERFSMKLDKLMEEITHRPVEHPSVVTLDLVSDMDDLIIPPLRYHVK